MTATLDEEVADLRRANAELQRRLDEGLAERNEGEAQKAAMAEILEVINTSPGDLAPVFDTMLEKATVLCEASFGILMTYDGRLFQTVALRGVPAAYAEFLRKPIYPAPQNGLGRLLSGEPRGLAISNPAVEDLNPTNCSDILFSGDVDVEQRG